MINSGKIVLISSVLAGFLLLGKKKKPASSTKSVTILCDSSGFRLVNGELLIIDLQVARESAYVNSPDFNCLLTNENNIKKGMQAYYDLYIYYLVGRGLSYKDIYTTLSNLLKKLKISLPIPTEMEINYIKEQENEGK